MRRSYHTYMHICMIGKPHFKRTHVTLGLRDSVVIQEVGGAPRDIFILGGLGWHQLHRTCLGDSYRPQLQALSSQPALEDMASVGILSSFDTCEACFQEHSRPALSGLYCPAGKHFVCEDCFDGWVLSESSAADCHIPKAAGQIWCLCKADVRSNRGCDSDRPFTEQVHPYNIRFRIPTASQPCSR